MYQEIYNIYCIIRYQYQCYLNNLIWVVTVVQLVAMTDDAVLGSVIEARLVQILHGKKYFKHLASQLISVLLEQHIWVVLMAQSVAIADGAVLGGVVEVVIYHYLFILYWGCLSGAVGSVGVWCSARRCCRGREFESR